MQAPLAVRAGGVEQCGTQVQIANGRTPAQTAVCPHAANSVDGGPGLLPWKLQCSFCSGCFFACGYLCGTFLTFEPCSFPQEDIFMFHLCRWILFWVLLS